ncbi:hypothetical protein GLOTRDRAFT_46618, partial [Gloeophyllum trabeum ATCC 11539]
RALVGGDWSLHSPLFRAMIRASALEGEIYVVKDPESKVIVSSGFWFPPRRELFGTEDQRALGFNDFFSKLSPESQYWWQNTYPQTMDKFNADTWNKEAHKRWWCFHLATDPKHQNRGYGTAIVNFVFEKASHHYLQGYMPGEHTVCQAKTANQIIGLAAALDVNVRKYLAMGLSERGQTYLDAPTGGFTVHVLSRG